MLLFVGLGNPGERFMGNRHNIGFMAVEVIAKRHGIAPWRRGFQGTIAEGTIATERVLLLLPGTFMNESGRAVYEAVKFHKIEPQSVVVFHDELDLPPGALRVKTGGGNAGHNGLRSISGQIGNDYRRVRFGIGHPGDKNLVYNYVLQDFAKNELPWVGAICGAVSENAGLLMTGNNDATFKINVNLAMVAADLLPSDGARPLPPS